MNLCNISSYLLIYIILWHGKRLNLIVNVASETALSGTEEQTPKSGTSSRTRNAQVVAGTIHSTHISKPYDHTSGLINLDVNVKQNTDEYTYVCQNDVHRFYANDNRWFGSASKRGKTFWTANNQNELGKKIVVSKVGGESRFRVYFSADSPETDVEGPPPQVPAHTRVVTPVPQPLPPQPLEVDVSENLVILDVKSKQSTQEYNYSYDQNNDVHVFKSVPPNLFGIIYKGKHVVWESEDGRYPNVALVLKDDLGNSFIRVYYPEKVLRPPVPVPRVPEVPAVPVVPKVPEVSEEEEKPPKRAIEVEEEVSEVEEEPKRKALIVEDVREALRVRMPIVVNLRSEKSTGQYTFSSEEGIGTFIAHDSFGFNSVVRNQETIWTARDPSQLATKVMCDGVHYFGKIKNVTIYLLDGNIRHYTKENDRWITMSNKLTLDVNGRSTTLHYKYLEHHDIGTFTTRHDCVFDHVVLGPYCCRSFCMDAGTPIWSSDGHHMSKKVVIYLNLCTVRASFISVHLSKNNIIHYEKRDSMWVKVSPLIELNIDKKDSCYEFYYSGYDEIRSYCANYNFVFTRVHESNRDIWRADKKKYAKMVMMNGDGNMLETNKLAIVLVNGKRIYYNKDRGSWTKAQYFPPFELDIDDAFSTDYVKYEADEENKTVTYTAQHGFLIRSVVQDEIIWFTESPSDYAVKVVLTNDKTELKILQKNGKTRQFTKPESSRSWVEVRPKTEKKVKREDLSNEIESGNLVPLVLDISTGYSTDYFTYKRKGDKDLYTAQDQVLFKGIQVGQKPGDKDKIWFPNNPEEYVKSVEIDLSDYPGFLNDVSLKLADGSKKQFVKLGQSKRWCEVINV